MLEEPGLVPAAERIDLARVIRGVGEVAGHDDGVVLGEDGGLEEVGGVRGDRHVAQLVAVLLLGVHGDVAHPHVLLDRHDLQLERDQQAERAVRPREGVEQLGVLVAGDAEQAAVGDDDLVGDDGLVEEADLVRVGGHADGHGQAADRGVLDLEGDGEHVAAREQVAGDAADGDEGLDAHGAAIEVDAEDVAQAAHLDLVPLVLGLEAGAEVLPGAPIGAHRAA